MSIPKILYQTYSSYHDLPLWNRIGIRLERSNYADYTYEFYDDARIDDFIESEYGGDTFGLYKKLAIGAAKADFFRYAILYKRGGVYLDVDSSIRKRLDLLMLADDVALISREENPDLFVQWALVYAPGHAFLAKTLDNVMANIKSNSYPHDVHRMTGPAAYSAAIRECLAKEPGLSYRVVGTDYEGFFRYKRPLSSMLYRKKPHWRTSQERSGVLKGETDKGTDEL